VRTSGRTEPNPPYIGVLRREAVGSRTRGSATTKSKNAARRPGPGSAIVATRPTVVGVRSASGQGRQQPEAFHGVVAFAGQDEEIAAVSPLGCAFEDDGLPSGAAQRDSRGEAGQAGAHDDR
jgi:hypothetical protein